MAREWFYQFRLPDGRVTPSYLPADVSTIHQTRTEMVDAALQRAQPAEWSQMSCIDLACHEGFFAVHMARRGCRDVLGVDARPQNIEGASLMREVYGLTNLRFDIADVYRIDAAVLGQFDVVLVMGLLYHLSDPIRALRVARSLTRGVCLIETQLGPNLTGVIDWGSFRYQKAIVGAFSVVDERDDLESGNREASTGPVSLVPSLDALLFILRRIGFRDVELVPPPAGANEQFAAGKRALVRAHA